MTKFHFVAATVALALVVAPADVRADGPAPTEFYLTGSARYSDKSMVVTHEMRALPAAKSVDGVVAALTTKKLTIAVRTELSCSVVTGDIRSALVRQGLTSSSKLAEVSAACTTTVKARSFIVVTYDAASEVTTLTFENQGSVSVVGASSMRAFWGVWLKDHDGGRLGPQLVARL